MSGRYIVMFKESASEAQIEQYKERLQAQGGNIYADYEPLLKGFSACVPDELIQSFTQDDLIDYIEPDGVITTQL